MSIMYVVVVVRLVVAWENQIRNTQHQSEDRPTNRPAATYGGSEQYRNFDTGVTTEDQMGHNSVTKTLMTSLTCLSSGNRKHVTDFFHLWKQFILSIDFFSFCFYVPYGETLLLLSYFYILIWLPHNLFISTTDSSVVTWKRRPFIFLSFCWSSVLIWIYFRQRAFSLWTWERRILNF